MNESRYVAMRNVARRFQKRWSLVNHPEHGWCWRQVVGGYETLESCPLDEFVAVRELDDLTPDAQMPPG